MTREAWLRKVVSRLRPRFREAGYKLPRQIQVSCGFTSDGESVKKKMVTLGETWVKDGRAEIFVSPIVDDSVTVAAVVVHELIHVALWKESPEHEHSDKIFHKAHREMGLVGPYLQSIPGKSLARALEAIIKEIGEYPHEALEV